MKMKKELELYYGAYKEFYQLKEVKGTYNSEKKTIKIKIESYIVAYDDLDRVRKTIHKADELNKMLIPNILQKEEIEKKLASFWIWMMMNLTISIAVLIQSHCGMTKNMLYIIQAQKIKKFSKIQKKTSCTCL